jgi:BASS family bile acid:Na+ symporter
VRNPDWDFLALSAFITVAMCASAFAMGWLIPRGFDADRSDQTAMMFGMGMNNNGTGLVLASTALVGHAQVLLPIILYNLVQQIVAGVVDQSSRSGGTPPEGTAASQVLGAANAALPDQPGNRL